MIPSEGGSEIQLTQSIRDGVQYYNHSPSWAPDGNSLVFTSREQDKLPDIWIINDVLTGIESNQISVSTPKLFLLEKNFPNPFNSSTTIRFYMSKSSYVTLIIYDLLGGIVETIVNDRRASGEYEFMWNAEDLPSGIYLCRLECQGTVESMKLILQR